MKNLQKGEFDSSVKNSRKPVSVIFKIITVKGGMNRPEGFEYPEEIKARLETEDVAAAAKSLEIKEQALNAKKKIRQREQELADEEAFLEFLDNEDAVILAVKEIKDGKERPTAMMTTSIAMYEKKKRMDSRLAKRLKRYWQNAE
ncbi:MAG: hypothetical protein JEZ12_12990 [Desulfobacterium sp.]|nr:hypothetical protein [Desulfobacterium sp.]